MVFIKKVTRPKFKKKNKPKPVQTGLARFFYLARFFSSFFRFGFGSVQFFRFQAYKTELVGFLKILISFFMVFFFNYFFLSFLDFLIFLSIHIIARHKKKKMALDWSV